MSRETAIRFDDFPTDAIAEKGGNPKFSEDGLALHFADLYSADSLHMNDAGYALWQQLISARIR